MSRAAWRIGAIVLARLDSSRLPGKGLISVVGKPLLAYVVERARAAAGVDLVVLATTGRPVDDRLEDFAREQGIGIFRGDLDDVAGRVLACARAFGLDAFARVNGDSPLLDFELLGRAVAELRAGDLDLVSNVLRRTYPPGMSVEVASTAAMARAHAAMTEPGHFEHVTAYFYAHPEDFAIRNLESGRPEWAGIHAAVDTPADLERFARILDRMPGGHLGWCGERVVELLQRDGQAPGAGRTGSMKEPLVSVYVTNHNYGRYVRQAVESVLAQSMQDFELLIIDDGSTDDSREIIAQYEGNPKVRVIFQENKGLNRTNNIALRASRGRYIMRLDADDYLDPQALLVLANKLEENPNLGLVFPDYYYVDAAGNVTGQVRRHDFDHTVSLMDQPAHGACTMIRKRSLQGVGGYCEDYRCQDGYDLWLRFVEKWEVSNVNLPLFYYRQHRENLTSNSEMIIATRAEIKKAHARRTDKPPCPTLVVVPVRGRSVDPGSLALEPLGDKTLLDWTLEAALEAEQVEGVVLTSPDPDVLAHGRERFGDRLHVLERPLALARESLGLAATLRHAREQARLGFDPRAFMVLSVETPFRGAMYLDKAVHTMRIFEVDSVIAIMPEDDLFFRHEGNGLVPLGNHGRENRIRFEREYLYRKLPGLHLVSAAYFQAHGEEMGGRIGHVVYTRYAALTVRTPLDLAMAQVAVAAGEG